MPSNAAAWLTAKATPLEVKESTFAAPGAGEILVKNGAVAINPVDWKMQDYGVFIQKYPVVLGCDVAGEAVEVGANVKHVKKGDRVLGHTIGLLTQESKHCGFQTYTVVDATLAAPIPASMSYEAASVLPLAISTAAAGLFQQNCLGLALPTVDTKRGSKDAAVLVWGGSGSVGASAVQLAVCAGYDVVTTASQRNFDFCRALGAAHVVDYKSDGVVDEIVAALGGKTLAGVMDCVSGEASIKACVAVLQQSRGEKKLATVLAGSNQGLPDDIKVASVFAPTIKDNEVGPGIYVDFLGKALEQGKLLPKPDPTVAGKGLESLQTALDKAREGVSAAKIVVSL